MPTFIKRTVFTLLSVVTVITVLNVSNATAAEPLPNLAPASHDAAKVMGAESCKKCHESEYKAWSMTMHFKNHERIVSAAGQQYAAKVGGIDSCAACHSTPHTATAKFAGTAGVSCESCHTPAGGADGWFELHSNYGAKDMKREAESAAHRTQRLAACDATSMIRASNTYALAKNCYSCHIVADEKLLQAGHKPGHGDFDLIPWIQGEIRHNFQVDQKTNAESPSLLQAVNGTTAAQRKRILLVVGKMVELEVCLENLAGIDAAGLKEGYAGRKGWAGRAEEAFEFLEDEIAKAIKNEHVAAGISAVKDIQLGRKFEDQAGAKVAAAKLAVATKAFAASAGTADLAGLDELVNDLDKPKGKTYNP
jgi:hypothetical protein